MLEFLEPDLGNLDTVTDCYGSFVIIYSINYALVSRRPEMGKKFGWTCGLPVDSPLLGFGTVKNSPGFV